MVYRVEDLILIDICTNSRSMALKHILENFLAKGGKFLVWIVTGTKIEKHWQYTRRRQWSGRPRSARTDDNVDSVNELISSQEGRHTPKSHRIIRQISRETGIRHSSVYHIVRQNLKLKCLKKRRAQELIVANCALRRNRARKLLRCFPASAVDVIFSLISLCEASGRHFEHLISSSFTVFCVHFELSD